MWARR